MQGLLGVERVQINHCVVVRFFIILNLALGGTFGGNIGLDLEYPLQYYVDYVRVFQAVDE